ncbi:MAG: hypothetical protein ACI4I1_07450 [Oscillospiraceae bacterium]
MAEYIEREALIKACKKIIHDRWNETTAPVSWSHAYADFIDDINNQPAADVQPVIRCRDCKWYKESKLLAPNKFCFRLKDRNGDPIGYNFAPDEFCSFGERKGEL